MSNNESRKFYSPDIQMYDLSGAPGVLNTIVSVVVAPIRLLTRVMHNIFVLPANLIEEYAKSLFIVASCMVVLGVLDLFLYKKWPMVVSQLPVFYYASVLKKQARKSTLISLHKREVDIDTERIETICNTVFEELKNVIKE